MRRIVEDELRRLGVRLRDLDPRLELGLQESVPARSRLRRHVHIAGGCRSDLASGALAEARIEDGREEEISLVRGTARVQTRAADAFVEFARDRLAALGGLGLVPATTGE